MSNATATRRTYVHNPVSPAEITTKLFQRGQVTVDLNKVVAQYAGQGVERDAAAVANNIRASVRMQGEKALTGALDTEIKNGKLVLRLNGNTPELPDTLPRVLQKMVDKGMKFTPTMVKALAGRGVKVQQHSQATA